MGENPTKRKRILLITRNLPPLRGGMERLNRQMAMALEANADVEVIGPAGCREHLPESIVVHEAPVMPLWAFLLRTAALAWRTTRQEFDVVLAGSGLMAPAAILAARHSGARAMVYVHGLDLVATHPLYRWLWIPMLRRLDAAIANSASTADLARRAGVARGNVGIVHPGTDLPDRIDSDPGPFRARFTLGQGPLLLSVGRLTERKGLREFVTHALPAIVARHPQARLVVIGDDAPDALRKGRGDSAAALDAAAAAAGFSQHVVRLGACDDATLRLAYAAADVHVFPVRQVAGDIEGFGMVAIEAAAHGLPTVAFAVGGVPDAVVDGVSGHLLRPGDHEGFADRVCAVVDAGRDAPMRASARAFAAGFAWERFGARLRAALHAPMRGGGQPAHQRGHAVLDLQSRNAKARKIERLLQLEPAERPLRMLEIGTGSGGIAHYFATHPAIACDVDAVDVEDTRQIRDGFRFTLVPGVELPFADASFDVVISNHVIEHVGDAAAQQRHIDELRRVLGPSGRGYLAVPNRWMLVEPHYRLMFLSWLPEAWRTPYLRWRRRGDGYDCRPLTVAQVEALLRAAGFGFEQAHGRALRLTYELERPDVLAYRCLLRHIPDGLYSAMRRAFPTLIYTLVPVRTA